MLSSPSLTLLHQRKAKALLLRESATSKSANKALTVWRTDECTANKKEKGTDHAAITSLT